MPTGTASFECLRRNWTCEPRHPWRAEPSETSRAVRPANCSRRVRRARANARNGKPYRSPCGGRVLQKIGCWSGPWRRSNSCTCGADLKHGVASDNVFFESGKCDGGLDGGARNGAVGVSELLIDDGEDASGVWIDGDNRTVVTAKSFDGSSTHDGIVVGANVAEGWINSLFARGAMTRRAQRLDGSFGEAWSSFDGKRAGETGGEEDCESCFSQPGYC